MTNNGSFTYTALQLDPRLFESRDAGPGAWSFERKDGYDIQLVQRVDGMYRWLVSFVVDGIDVTLDVHQANVIAVSVGPREQ